MPRALFWSPAAAALATQWPTPGRQSCGVVEHLLERMLQDAGDQERGFQGGRVLPAFDRVDGLAGPYVLLLLAPKPHTIADTISPTTLRIRPMVITAPTMVRS